RPPPRAARHRSPRHHRLHLRPRRVHGLDRLRREQVRPARHARGAAGRVGAHGRAHDDRLAGTGGHADLGPDRPRRAARIHQAQRDAAGGRRSGGGAVRGHAGPARRRHGDPVAAHRVFAARLRQMRQSFLASLVVVCAPILARAQSLPPLPDTTGFGVHVLALARAPDNAVWVGTYGQGIFVLRQGAGSWEQIKHSSDTTGRTISFDFVHAFGFGPNGEIWYGTVGNGWGLSTDGGKTWTNWEFKQLGPEWQYVAPNGIATRGDTVYIATADGIKLSWDRGAIWAEITDSVGATTAQHVVGRLPDQYVQALAAGPEGSLWAAHLRGVARSSDGGRSWIEFPAPGR